MTRSRSAARCRSAISAYDYFSIPEAEKALGDLSRLPFSLKVLLENLLRFEDGRSVTVDHLKAMRALAGRADLRAGDRLPARRAC